jgi:hypothetical protein
MNTLPPRIEDESSTGLAPDAPAADAGSEADVPAGTEWVHDWHTAGGLLLPLHRQTLLVTIDAVRAVRGLDAEGVWAEVDQGRLRWVWDISTRPHGRDTRTLSVRELRFWVAELIAPELCQPLAPEQAFALILGKGRQQWRAGEVMQGLLCSRSFVKRLIDAGELSGPIAGHTRWITRSSLAAFLRRRLIG